MVQAQQQKAPAKKKSASPCSCHEAPPAQTCCDIICFERPNFFAGQLLTDEDLALQQRYFREKNKLYHRTLHGYGVVCGLRLNCDCKCPGSILVGEGFAIDDCGNDLVVCEAMHFPVIDRLRELGLIVAEKPEDPCRPSTEPECKDRQCFYVTICYQEEETDYTTPLIGGCGTTAGECKATRIRETVRFDVASKLPKETGLAGLRKCFQHCWRLFDSSQFAQGLRDNSATVANAIGQKAGTRDTYFNVFCLLRGRLLLYLTQHPDRSNCALEDEIRNIPFPKGEEGDGFATEVQTAYCRLLELAYQSVVSCLFECLVFPCCAPDEASCVLLGTVEVEDGKVVRVCNCPRSYVWSFANFFPVLFATLFGSRACQEENHGDENTGHVCCAEFALDCQQFLKLFSAREGAVGLASRASLNAVSSVMESLRNAFDFTRQDVVPAQLFVGLTVDQAKKAASDLGVTLTIADDRAPSPPVLDPLTTFQQSQLYTAKTPLVAFLSGDRIVAVQPAVGSIFGTPQPGGTAPAGGASPAPADWKAEFDRLQTRLTAAEQELTALKQRLPPAPESPPPPAAPPS